MRTVGNCGCTDRARTAGLRLGDGSVSTASNIGVRTAVGLLAVTAMLITGVVLVTR